MEPRVKYFRTMHLPFSPGVQNDDRVIQSLDAFEGKEVVVTEKMDGESCTMYRDGLHARSIDGRYHPSRNWVKRFWGSIQSRIQPGVRICGENMYAKHSIAYDDLESYFLAFNIWDGEICLSWDHTAFICQNMKIAMVPVLWRDVFDRVKIQELAAGLDTEKQEGLVIRVADSFTRDQTSTHIAKWVRDGHVQTDAHWMHQEVIPNGLRDDRECVESSDGTKKWYRNGKLHREDGPAVERADGTEEWYLYDRPYTFDDWLNELDVSDEDKLLLKLTWG